MMRIKYFAFVVFVLLQATQVFSHDNHVKNNKLSVNFKKMDIHDAFHEVAKLLDLNVIVSEKVDDVVSFNFSNIKNIAALDALLMAKQYKRWRIGEAWYIGTFDEFNEYKKITNDEQSLKSKTWQIKYAKVLDIANIIKGNKNSILSKKGFLTVDARTNTLCVLDQALNINAIDRLLKAVDVPVKQIVIKVIVANIDSDYEKNLGLSFSSKDSANQDLGKYSLTVIPFKNIYNIEVILSALERNGHGEIISSPSLITSNQKTAYIEAGEEIPYQESSSSGATSVTFKKAALSLKVLPQIMPNNSVLMQIEVSQDQPNKRMVLGVPAISTRRISTNIKLQSEETIVLGGIYESNRSHNRRVVPVLSSIPILGKIFKGEGYFKSKRELLVFVTPKIVD